MTASVLIMTVLCVGAFALAIAVARMSQFHGKPFLVTAQIAGCGWVFTTVAELVAQSPDQRIFWSSVSWLAIVVTPTAWSLFIHRYINNIRGRTRWYEVALLTLSPALIVSFVTTSHLHQSFYGPATGQVAAVSDGPLRSDYGWLFYGAVGYLYLFMAYSTGVMTRGALFAAKLHRTRFRAMLALTMLPVMTNICYVVFGVTIAGVDGTPFAFLLATAAFSWLLLSDQFFSLLPIGNRVLMEKLQEPVLFVGAGGQIVSANPAADKLRLLNDAGEGNWHPDLLAQLPNMQQMQETAKVVPIGAHHYEVQVAVLEAPFSASGEPAGWMLLLKDVTALKLQALNLEYALRHSERRRNAASTLLDELRSQATTDTLTGLSNRRALDNWLTNFTQDPNTRDQNLLLAVLDIDHFKKINDQYGHSTGDAVLRRFAEAAVRHFRSSDLIFRTGGEEFLLMLPGMSEIELNVRLDLIRHELSTNKPVRIKFSAGVAMWTGQREGFDEAYDLADKRLYVAKTSGRDRTIGTKTAILTLVPASKSA